MLYYCIVWFLGLHDVSIWLWSWGLCISREEHLLRVLSKQVLLLHLYPTSFPVIHPLSDDSKSCRFFSHLIFVFAVALEISRILPPTPTAGCMSCLFVVPVHCTSYNICSSAKSQLWFCNWHPPRSNPTLKDPNSQIHRRSTHRIHFLLSPHSTTTTTTHNPLPPHTTITKPPPRL